MGYSAIMDTLRCLLIFLRVVMAMQAELSEDGGHSDDESDDDGDAAEQEKLLVGHPFAYTA